MSQGRKSKAAQFHTPRKILFDFYPSVSPHSRLIHPHTADIAEAFIEEAKRISSDIKMPFLIISATFFLLFLSFLCFCCFRARALRMMVAAGKTDDDAETDGTDAGVRMRG